MTQEDKKLLLKVICMMLPYGVICTDLRHGDSKITEVDIEDGLVYCFDFDEWVKVENCRLYLRPMSSMTEEEKEEYEMLQTYPGFKTNHTDLTDMYDWLNEKKFDYRGLIPMDLALEALKGMY